MTLALCIDPYEFDEPEGLVVCGHSWCGDDCTTPDDLSDVDLNHPNFRAAFPDGVVPIVHVPMARLGYGDGFFAWAENVLAVCDHVEGVDVDAVMDLREQLVDFTLANDYCGIGEQNAAVAERRQLMGQLLQQSGLTLRQAARLLGWSLNDTVEVALGHAEYRYRPLAVCDAEEAMREGMSIRGAERTYGVGRNVLVRLQKLTKGVQ